MCLRITSFLLSNKAVYGAQAHAYTHTHTHIHTGASNAYKVTPGNKSAVLTCSEGQKLAGSLHDIVPVPPAVRTWLL